MKTLLCMLALLCPGIGAAWGKEETVGKFDVSYQVVSGAQLNQMFDLGKPCTSDCFYVVGKISSRLEKNALVEIRFRHNQAACSFNTGLKSLGWINGNHSPGLFFLIPIGEAHTPPPKDRYDMECTVNIQMIK